MFTKGKWEAGFNPNVTGPTTPTIQPFCGGGDWPYRTVNMGSETIALIPAQAKDKTIGRHSEPLLETAKGNADLIVSAVNACQEVNPDNPQVVAESIKDMYEALRAIIQGIDTGEERLGAGRREIIEQALSKAEGKE